MQNSYGRFFAMIATSTLLMYGLMYANSWSWDHLRFSETRVFMALYMGAMMMVVMLSFMLGMYTRKAVNAAIVVGAAALFALSLWLLRSQTTVQDASWMRAMIPHHSIAILTSERAEISDPRVMKLAREIIAAQEREISEMEWLVAALEDGAEAGGDWPLGHAEAEVLPLERALATPDIATIDPEGMSEEEIARVLPDGAVCRFAYSPGQAVVLAVDAEGAGVVKLSGDLVPVTMTGGTVPGGPVVETEGLRAEVVPEIEDGARLDFALSIGPGLRTAYRGVYLCAA